MMLQRVVAGPAISVPEAVRCDDCLTGWVEVDETYVGGVHPGRRGRQKYSEHLRVGTID